MNCQHENLIHVTVLVSVKLKIQLLESNNYFQYFSNILLSKHLTDKNAYNSNYINGFIRARNEVVKV